MQRTGVSESDRTGCSPRSHGSPAQPVRLRPLWRSRSAPAQRTQVVVDLDVATAVLLRVAT